MWLRVLTGGRKSVFLFLNQVCSLLGIGAEGGKNLQQIVCYRAGSEAGELDLEERRESKDLNFT